SVGGHNKEHLIRRFSRRRRSKQLRRRLVPRDALGTAKICRCQAIDVCRRAGRAETAAVRKRSSSVRRGRRLSSSLLRLQLASSVHLFVACLVTSAAPAVAHTSDTLAVACHSHRAIGPLASCPIRRSSRSSARGRNCPALSASPASRRNIVPLS